MSAARPPEGTPVCAGVDLQVRDRVATITLRNPAKFNAMTLDMWQSLAALAGRIHEHAEARVLVVTGEGERAFVSGADISEFAQQRCGVEAVAAYDRAVDAAQQALAACPLPTIARIQGICMGGGIGIALACDLRYASSQARFRMPAAQLGLGYALDGMQRIVQVMGAPRALELFYGAQTLDAPQAARMGLVNEVFDNEAFDLEVQRRALQIAAHAPLSLRAAKAAVLAVLRGTVERDRATVDRLVAQCFASRDYAEGQAAFRERRAPVFEGR